MAVLSLHHFATCVVLRERLEQVHIARPHCHLLTQLLCLPQISYYDISRGVYDLAGRVKVTGTMGVPLCLSSAVEEKSEQENIIYGDDSGAVIMLQCGRPDMPVKVLKQGDFLYVHDDHTDWVTQVRLLAAASAFGLSSHPLLHEMAPRTCLTHAPKLEYAVWM